MDVKPKLSMLKQIEDCSMESSCAWLKTKNERRMMLKLRGGTAAFEIETGRWNGWVERTVCVRSVAVVTWRM